MNIMKKDLIKILTAEGFFCTLECPKRRHATFYSLSAQCYSRKVHFDGERNTFCSDVFKMNHFIFVCLKALK